MQKYILILLLLPLTAEAYSLPSLGRADIAWCDAMYDSLYYFEEVPRTIEQECRKRFQVRTMRTIVEIRR